ncbi:hypothetical protein [Saccharopolyspora spinosa]|nr:hypothetical protein [Saccharopolyspora spinosa]
MRTTIAPERVTTLRTRGGIAQEGVAERLPRSVHVRGDSFRRMVIGGREEMSATPSDEALRQLRLRHRLTAQTSAEPGPKPRCDRQRPYAYSYW